jgi:peptidyl-prolyl cis-trans isomerase B (cyclophilin B)
MSKQYPSAPPMSIDTAKNYTASIETNRGTIVVQLFAADAPFTVNNFVFLARDGFYNGVKFHRVIEDFMVQGGDPTGTGSGGPGYKFHDEVFGNPHTHGTGALSMANAGPNTNGSQFFITHSPQPHLNGKHTVFGKVTQGQDIVDSIRKGDAITSIAISEN